MVTNKLKDIVKEYLFEIGESNESKFARFYQYALSFLRESNMNQSGVSKIVAIQMNPNDYIDLPVDYITYKNIGLVGSDGELHALGRNDKLALMDSYNSCGTPTTLSFQQSVVGRPFVLGYPYDANWVNGELVGRFFGIGGGKNANGDYKVDRQNGRILLHGLNFQINIVVLEYLADISLVNGDFEVHPFLIESMKAWMYWKSIQRDRNMPVSAKQVAENDYRIAERWATKRFMYATVDEYTMAFRTGNKAAPKF